jgi:predicted RNA binding protein YcfA (HicA-like mRNA interferase family)
MIERSSRKIIQRLEAEGYKKISQKGSHVKMAKNGKPVIIPHPKRDLPTGTARAIAKQVGWI